jgi:hypothetical protein
MGVLVPGRVDLRQAARTNPWLVCQCEGSRECPIGLECPVWITESAKHNLKTENFTEGGQHVHRHYVKIDAYNVVRFRPGEPRHPRGFGPFEHYERGGFTKEQAERHAARLNGEPL